MAKMNYDAINFKNRDIDKFSTKFGQTKTDPEKEAARKATQTAGMTEAEKNLYNQKGKLGQKMFAKDVAKKNVAAESNRSSTTTKTAKTQLTPEQKEIKKTNRRENFNKTVSTLATAGATALGALGLYQQAKNKKED